MALPGPRPRYVPQPAKAVEVILWLAEHWSGIDVYHLVKAVYFADRRHITEYGRPIIGDDYGAAPFGPLPQVVYGLLRHDPIEVLAASSNGRLPFHVTDAFAVIPDREPNLRLLSESDQSALAFGLSKVRGKSFAELCDLTHEDAAFRNADGGRMDYRDFIAEDDPDR
ncbi:MAG: DUF4065 domain-containing protein, partial [Alphaproteobacteria bacterium]|nr:DUF4065 domain-containing protein [Alphaproteobacteria bacterium]